MRACGAAGELGGGARPGGVAGRAAAGRSRRRRPRGRAGGRSRISQTCSATRRATGPSFPGAIIRTRRLPGGPPARVGAEPAGGAGIPPRGPPPAAPPGRSLPRAPRAPPSRPPANCVPPGPARSHMPPQGMPGLSGGGRALGRAGPGRERPAGKVGERERASPHPRPACAPPQPHRGVSHFPRPTRGLDDPRAPGGWERPGAGAGRLGPAPAAPAPLRAAPVPDGSEEGAGRCVSPHPSPPPPALGPRWGAGG